MTTHTQHIDEPYKLELYNSTGANASSDAYCELLIADDLGHTLEVYVASIASSDKNIQNMKWLFQNSKEGRIFRAEGYAKAEGHINRKARAHYKKDRYTTHDLKIEEVMHTLFVSKQIEPTTKERQQWQQEEDQRLKDGLHPRPLPNELAEMVIAWDGDIETQLYSVLNDRYATPMHTDWKSYIISMMMELGFYKHLNVYTFGNENPVKAGLVRVTEKQLESIISEGIASYEIDFAILEDPNAVPVLDSISSLDGYLTHFSGELGAVIQDSIELAFDPTEDRHHPRFYDVNLAANEQGITGLFPPQADTVMGVANTLKNDDFCFVIGEMGVGKTVIGDVAPYIAQAVLTEGGHTQGRTTKSKIAKKRLVAEGKIKSKAGINSSEFGQELKQWLQNEDNSKLYKYYLETARIRNIKPLEPFRTIIFSLNIMVEKWKREVKERVPNAEVYEIASWQDVMDLYKRNMYMHTKSNGKVVQRFRKPECVEYYVINSDLPKFTYPMVPMPDFRYSQTDVYAQKALYREQMAEYRSALTVYNERRAENPNELLEVPQKPKAPRIRFMKEEVFNRARNVDEVIVKSSETGQHCPSCGGVLWEKKDVPSTIHFYEGRSNGKWSPRQKDINMVCKNSVPTKYLPKSQVKDRTAEEQTCGYKLWKPEKLAPGSGYRKVSPIWLLNRFFPRGFFKFLVADEVHEYKSGESKIGQAFGQLINHTEKQILLTGTLMGGMAEDVFYLLARLAPKRLMKESISYKDSNLFTQRYGVFEKKFNDQSGNMRQTSSAKKPGVSPHLFPLHLMRNCAFLELADLGYALPPYQEIPVLVDMDPDHHDEYKAIEAEVGAKMRQNSHFGGMRYVSTYINAMYQYADAPFNMPRIVTEDELGNEHVLATPVCFDKDDFTPSKFRTLDNLLSDEIYTKNRKVLVYVKYTGTAAYNQMDTYLYDKLKALGYKVGILRSNGSYDGIKMPKNAKEREKWMKEMMERYDWDVLITNPKLVKVGLDLLQFPSIVYYQMDYSTFDYMQSSRRSWRIKQTEEVRIYTLVYADTLQQSVLEHIAKKIDAAMAMQGKFSEEGLRAMSDSNDGMTALAKSLLKEGKLDTIETIHERFQRLNHSYEELQSAQYEDYQYYEVNPIEGGMETVKAIAQGLIREIEHKVQTGLASPEELIAFMEKFDEIMRVVEDVSAYNKGLKKKERVMEGQLVLDF